MSDEPVFVEVTVTCQDPLCGNGGHPITFSVPQGCLVVCGVCGATLVEAIR